jgi:hypothetical protein
MRLFGKIVLGMAGVGLVGAAVLCSEGLVHVKVIEKRPQGLHINVIAPAMLAPIAVHFTPQRYLAQAAQQIQPYMPTIRAALEGLRDSEDAVLVEVKEPGEHVQVSKSHGSIVVDVDDASDTVHVSTPIRAVSSTVNQLAAASSNSLKSQSTAGVAPSLQGGSLIGPGGSVLRRVPYEMSLLHAM